MRRHRFLLFLAAVFAAKLVVVLQLRNHPLLQPDIPGFESTAYVLAAARIGWGEFWISPYMHLLAVTMSVTKVIAASRIVQIVLGTATVACVFAAARPWFGVRAAWLAALLAALTGLFTFYETTILPSALDPFLTAAFLAALAVGLAPPQQVTRSGKGTTPPTRWFTVAGVALALLLANRPASLNDGLYFYVGNNASSDGTYRPVAGIAAEDPLQQREDARSVAEASAGRKLDDRGVSAYFRSLGRSWIGLHPGDAAAHFGRKLALAFNAGHIAASYSFPFYAYDARTLLAALIVGPWLLLPLGLVGLAIGVLQAPRRPYLIWLSFVPLYALWVALFVVTERDRLPLLVPLCIGAGAAVEFLIFRRESRPSGGARIGALAAIVVLALLTNWPARRDNGRAEERTRMAEVMIVRDQIEAANEWAGKAEIIHSSPAVVHLRVGRRLTLHSRPDAAISHLHRALQLEPADPDVNYAMGQALVEAKRPREAIPRLRDAMKAGARVNLAGYDLARALAASGDRAGALQTLQGVRPDSPADFQGWNALGRLAMQLESPSLAAAFFSDAVTASPRAPGPRQDLGRALGMMGRHAEAIAHLEQAVALDAADPEAQLSLAVAYADAGRPAEARSRAQEALRLKPDYQRARQFLRTVK